MVKKTLSLYLSLLLAFPAAVLADESSEVSYDIINIEAGDPAPFDGVLLSLSAAAKIVTEKKFESATCELRIGYELNRQSERYQLQLDYKELEILSWKDRYESMMILKAVENDRLEKIILKQNPSKEPWMVALGFGIGTLTSLGIFALSTEIVK